MSLIKLPYKSLTEAIRKNLSDYESASTKALVQELKVAKKRQYLTKHELIIISMWKSPRVINQIKRNTENKVIKVTKEAFREKDEALKMKMLLSLFGVGIPMASALLTLTDPKRYGVIDIRVWQVLYSLKVVEENAEGVKFSIDQWILFLSLVRSYSKKVHVYCRTIERTLFEIHIRFQKGLLYK